MDWVQRHVDEFDGAVKRKDFLDVILVNVARQFADVDFSRLWSWAPLLSPGSAEIKPTKLILEQNFPVNKKR